MGVAVMRQLRDAEPAMSKSSPNHNATAIALSASGLLMGAVVVAFGVFGIYRCPTLGENASRISLCEQSWQIAAGGLLVLASVSGTTLLWAERPKPVVSFLLGIVLSFFWILLIEVGRETVPPRRRITSN